MFVQIHRCTTPKVKSNKKYGLLMKMMCQVLIILGNKCSILMSGVDSGGTYVGTEDRQEISVPSLKFCCEPKTALEKPY